MPNKYRNIYLFELPIDECLDMMTPYRGGYMHLPKALNGEELSRFLINLADENPNQMFFSFRKKGNMYRVYKTGEEENDNRLI